MSALRAAMLIAVTLTMAACDGSRLGLPTNVSDFRFGAQSSTMVMVIRGEPETLAAHELTPSTGARFQTVPRLFNAGLVILDGQEVPRAYLAQEAPQLETDTWRLLPDGRMETIYVLRPGLTWQDGTLLSAEDFVFGWHVFAGPGAPLAASTPISEIEEVTAQDARTVVITWKELYPQAGALEARDFQALPRHRLQSMYDRGQMDALRHSTFWTTEYLGLGPYRLSHWEAGSSLEATAFDGHAWGRPKISRIKVLFEPDFDGVLSAMLRGDAEVAVDDALRFPQAVALEHDWIPRAGGTVLTIPSQWRRVEMQHRADFANPRALLDVRVRRALANSVDRAALNDTLFNGEATLADSFVPPTVSYFPVVEQSVSHYEYDPRRAERLMEETGYTRGTDGVFTRPGDGRFSAELKVNATPLAENEIGVLADSWRRAGFDIRETPVAPAQSRLGEVRSTFPSLYTVGGPVGDTALAAYTSTRLATAQNRWTGSNRSGWVSPEFDRLYSTFQRTLDRGDRTGQLAEMARLLSQRLAVISLYFNPGAVAYAARIEGPQPFTPAGDFGWNVHQWVLKG